jgi:hypothetical protein
MSNIPHIKNINIERTLKELGVDVYSLKPASCKPVFRICSICGIEDIKKFHSVSYVGQTKCSMCSNKINSNTNIDKRIMSYKEWLKNHVHPRKGSKVSPENILKMVAGSRNRIRTQEELDRLRDRMTGEKNPFYGKTHTSEVRHLMSDLAKIRVRRGKDSNFYGKTYYSKQVIYTDSKGRIHKLKSGWELKVANLLDKQNKEWDYEKQYYPITYVDNNGQIKQGTYIPDFFVDDEIWEVKGYWRKDARLKFGAFLLAYPTLKVKLFQREQLKELGIKGI